MGIALLRVFFKSALQPDRRGDKIERKDIYYSSLFLKKEQPLFREK
jgi:hypothetical protein